MDYQINIADLTRQVFGIPGYLPSLSPGDSGTINYTGVKSLSTDSEILETNPDILETDPKMSESLLNQPLMDVIRFDYVDENNKPQTFLLKDAPIITITRPRNIVKTAIQGRKGGGTIKEFVSNDDYHITVNGLLAHEEDRMPWDLMQDLNQILTADRSYKIMSKFLTLLGINSVVIDQINETKPVDGFTNLIQYTFTMLSDDAPELSI